MFGDDSCGDPALISPGSVLIASTSLVGPTFVRSVIYMIEHDENGSLGVVLNRMSQAAVFNVLPRWAELAAAPRAVFIGGPVQTESAVCLGVAKTGIDLAAQPRLHQVRGPVCMVDLDADPDELHPFLTGVRIFAGYAGWDAGQLAEEVSEGSWLIAPGLPADLLAPATVDVWHEVLKRQQWPLSLLATYPDDPRTN
ncbi:MAG: YqgE/AlgH family protein [Gordonia sp. (in: high G+C Gram-positive bacteria)]|uniref:YqgE/AlgH family protein n=1 Tax=Gordonia sp. (in: high G+C Gram-positive bacteria) TaxID=84139 RepID=UPI003BB54598